jgi:tetratricopeptide (TPR) repeat protein
VYTADQMTSAETLARIIRGDYRPYLDLSDDELPRDDLGRLAWAQVALYRGRVDDAARALFETPEAAWPEHHRNLTAEVLFARGEYDALEERLADVECPTSLLNLARVSYKRCDWHEAERRASRAIELSRALGLDFTEGRALHIRATARKELGRLDAARHDYERAIPLLDGTEAGRFLAYAENDFGWLLADRGDLCGAESHILAAYETAVAVGHEGDLALYTLARLEITHRAGRYAEVVAGAPALAELLRAQGAIANEIFTLRVWAMALLALDRAGEAVALAEAARTLAEIERTEDLVMHRALELRALARAGRGRARDLQRHLADVDRADVPRWSALARLWCVDAALTEHPELAAVTVADYWPARLVPGCWLTAAEAHAIAAVRRPYRVTVDGEFYCSARDPRAFPHPRDARRYTQLAITAGAVKIVGDGWGAGADLAALLDVGASQASSKAAEVRRIARLPEETAEQFAEGGGDCAE